MVYSVLNRILRGLDFEKREKEGGFMKNPLIVITKFLLDFMYFSGMLVCLTLPFSFKWYGQYNSRFVRFYWPLVVLFLLSGILAILIIGQLRRIFDTVLQEDCFVMANVTALRRMGTYSFLIAFVALFRLLFYITPSILIIILVFVIAGLFSKVLAYVFDQAVRYKLENDLTI